MIHTLISETTIDLDKAVNKFMQEKKADLPVRTETFMKGNTLFHKATIFYNEAFKDNRTFDESGKVTEEIVVGDSEPKEKPKDRGALWTQKDGKVSGNWKSEPVTMPQTVVEKLNTGEKVDITLKGEKVFVMKNKFKKTAKHPDYVILVRKSGG